MNCIRNILAAVLMTFALPVQAQTFQVPMPITCAPLEQGIQWLKDKGYTPTASGKDANEDDWVVFEDSKGNFMLMLREDDMLCKVGGGPKWNSGKPL